MFNAARHLDFIEDLNQTTSLAETKKVMFSEYAKHEVSSIYYGCISSFDDFERHNLTKVVHGISNHPEQWFEAFGVETCLDNDLTAYLCACAQETIIWHDEELWKGATNAEREQAEFENEIGLNAGITMPLRSPNQQNIAMIGLSMGGVKTADFDTYWREKQEIISEIGQISNMVIQDRYMNEICNVIDLTPRCLEFLKFCAHGFTYKQIGQKMHTSEANINQIARQSVRQLDARNVTNAVFKALNLKLLPL